MATPVEERTPVTEPIHTADLPSGPQRDRMIPATVWVEAPPELLELGSDLGHELAAYIRRIGRFLLWRSGPAVGGDSRYLALAADDLTEQYAYRLFPDGTGEGFGPDGVPQTRFRTWKESLRDG